MPTKRHNFAYVWMFAGKKSCDARSLAEKDAHERVQSRTERRSDILDNHNYRERGLGCGWVLHHPRANLKTNASLPNGRVREGRVSRASSTMVSIAVPPCSGTQEARGARVKRRPSAARASRYRNRRFRQVVSTIEMIYSEGNRHACSRSYARP
jgi:hypothetical protein